MICRDYHMHTSFCDGSNTAEEMIQAAVDRGLQEIGISGHSHTAFDESYCMSQETTRQYIQLLRELRSRYQDRISVRIGLEMDRYSDAQTEEFDYLICSVHYVRMPALQGTPPKGVLRMGSYDYIPVDETAEIQKAAADAYFGGDMIALAEEFFKAVGEAAEMKGCRILGHFDLIAKFNEGNAVYDENDPRYVAAWKQAADRVLQTDVLIEINTGAMSKGYRSQPYPAGPIRDYIAGKGGRFILSSDSHRTGTLCYAFDQYEAEASCDELEDR